MKEASTKNMHDNEDFLKYGNINASYSSRKEKKRKEKKRKEKKRKENLIKSLY
jgi:hypothetical protein